MKIGNIELETPVLSAPLAGYTDSPMRVIMRGFGASLIYSEMLKAAAVVRKNKKTFEMAAITAPERPVVIQLAGRRPEEIAEAARILAALKPAAFDLNAGCPVRKITSECAGAVLLKEPNLVKEILRALVAAAGGIPVTVKIRLGWDDSTLTGVEIARIAEGEGAAAVIVHGRTAVQIYHGICSHEGIAEIVRAVSIPVIANGDIKSAADAVQMLADTGAAGVMVGRGAVGRPWIFREINAGIAGEPIPPAPEPPEIINIMNAHLVLMEKRYGAFQGVRIFRKHAAAYVKGMPEYRTIRNRIMQFTSRAEFDAIFLEILEICKREKT
jgi:tRNA-dihydrouridine synthase B